MYMHKNGGVFCCHVRLHLYTHATCNDMTRKKNALRVRYINNNVIIYEDMQYIYIYIYNNFNNVYKTCSRAHESIDKLWRNSILCIY